MKKVSLSDNEMREQIKKGLNLTFQKLLKSKRQTDSYLVFSENGKIKKIKAADIPMLEVSVAHDTDKKTN